MWRSDRHDSSSASRRSRFGVPTQVLVFGSVTVVLLGCWGVLKFAPDPVEPGPAGPAATEPDGMTRVVTMRNIPANQTAAQARAQQQNEEIRLLQLKPLSVEIRKVVGPQMPEAELVGLAAQVIQLCDDKAQAKEQAILRGVPSGRVQAVIEAACPTS